MLRETIKTLFETMDSIGKEFADRIEKLFYIKTNSFSIPKEDLKSPLMVFYVPKEVKPNRDESIYILVAVKGVLSTDRYDSVDLISAGTLNVMHRGHSTLKSQEFEEKLKGFLKDLRIVNTEVSPLTEDLEKRFFYHLFSKKIGLFEGSVYT